jgi:heme oxygenase (biliverdin-IX-beta and delta-forming)
MIISQEIKNATAQSHQALEKLIVDQIRSISGPRDYAYLLALFSGFFGGLELLIDEYVSAQYLPDLHDRRKAYLIAEDLRNLGGQVPKTSGLEFLPVIENHFQAFGALYVMEGSSLGGGHIVKMIRKKLPETDAFLFFSGYGEHTVDMWNRFKIYLDQTSGTPDEINSMISTARDTFLKFAEWIMSKIEPEILT